MFITSKINKKRGNEVKNELHHFHDFAFASHQKLNNSIRQSKQRVVATDPHIISRMEFGPALAQNNLTGSDRLPPVTLYSEHLGIRIPAVPG
jgi:hypothetical protein